MPELLLLAFLVAWILGVVLSGVAWRRGSRWGSYRRLLTATTVAALFLTPSFIVGHGAVLSPLMVTLVYHSSDLLKSPQLMWMLALPLAGTWVLCLGVFLFLQIRERRNEAA